MHRGEERTAGGRLGEAPAVALSDTLRALGFPTVRLKTGTTPRIDKKIGGLRADRAAIESEPDAPPFSFLHDSVGIPDLLPSWLTYTNERTHAVIRGEPGPLGHVRRPHRGLRAALLPEHRRQDRQVRATSPATRSFWNRKAGTRTRSMSRAPARRCPPKSSWSSCTRSPAWRSA